MKGLFSRTCITILLLLSISGTYINWVHHLRVMNRIDVVQKGVLRTMTSKTSKWNSGGTEHHVTTYRQEGESLEKFCARHRAELEAMQEEFPPDN